jgi:hypothetical protein
MTGVVYGRQRGDAAHTSVGNQLTLGIGIKKGNIRKPKVLPEVSEQTVNLDIVAGNGSGLRPRFS